jgi:putative RNA 2'-phosphotransferase
MGKARSANNLAKMLAYVLGRRPDEFGLIPDAEGFVRIKDLLKALHEEEGWGYVSLSHLNEVLLSVPGAPFEIRQNDIHSVDRNTPDLRVSARELPKLLYACIRRRAYPHVHAEGIHPSSHPRVVLVADRVLAERLGRRIDPDPVILTVNVRCACEAGVVFDPSGEGLFLADHIPPDCFSGPAVPREKPSDTGKPTPENGVSRPTMPGGFPLDMEKAASAHVPPSLKRRTDKGQKTDRKRLKQEKWTREKPPWKN